MGGKWRVVGGGWWEVEGLGTGARTRDNKR